MTPEDGPLERNRTISPMKAMKRALAVILLLVGLLFALVAISVLSDNDTTGEPTNWVGFCTSSSIGIVGIALGVRTLLRLRAPSPTASRFAGNQTVAKVANVTKAPQRSSPSIFSSLVKGVAMLAAVGVAVDQVERAKRSREKNYQCDKCGTAIQSGQQPTMSRCPSGGYHSWNNLGLVGATNYQCGKCRVTVKSAERPEVVRCPAGAYHDWNRL